MRVCGARQGFVVRIAVSVALDELMRKSARKAAYTGLLLGALACDSGEEAKQSAGVGGSSAGTAAMAGAAAQAGVGAAAGSGTVAGSGAVAGSVAVAGSGAGGAAGSGGLAGSGGTGGGCAESKPLEPTGATIDVTPPMTLANALAGAKAGDRIVLHAGAYGSESISKASFDQHVFVEVAQGDTVTLPGLHFTSCDHLVLDGLHVDGTLELEGSSELVLRHVTLTGQGEEAALQFQGQHVAGANHDVRVEDSSIGGGGRTVFILGKFAPAEQWNHHLAFVRTQFTCGSHNCFQISGGRDITITDDEITSDTTAGVLTAGAARVEIARTRFAAKDGSAMQIATPGMEWDNYAGVENMISSQVVIANNVVSGFKVGVQLDAARDVAIVYNTFVDGTGVRFNHRTPHDQAQNVILDGNDDVRIWNDIMPSLSVAPGEKPPAVLSNNLISGAGAGGDNPVQGDPKLDAKNGYALLPGSAALDQALVNVETPPVDFEGRPRGDKPDLGARELGAAAPNCPVP